MRNDKRLGDVVDTVVKMGKERCQRAIPLTSPSSQHKEDFNDQQSCNDADDVVEIGRRSVMKVRSMILISG